MTLARRSLAAPAITTLFVHDVLTDGPLH